MNSYWQNEFHHEDTHTPCDDAYLTLYHSFVRLSMARLTRSSYACDLVPTKLLHAHVYNHLDSFQVCVQRSYTPWKTLIILPFDN